MADQDAKNQRRAAKGRFTRKLAELTKSIEEDKGSEIVGVNFEQLNEAWRNVEAKHDMYTTFLKDSEVEESETWIAELQSSFSEAMEKQVEYIGSKAAKAMVEKQVLSQQEAAKKDYIKRKKDFIKRDTEEVVFRALLEDAFKLLEACEADKDVVPALRKVQQALEASLAGCKVANDKYLEFLSREEASTEVGWILVVQKRYNQVVDRIESVIANQTKVEVGAEKS